MKCFASALSISRLPQIMAIFCSVGFLSVGTNDSFAANVVQRGTAATRTAPRTNTTNRVVAVPTAPSVVEANTETVVETITEAVPETQEVQVIVENKSSRFDQVLDTVSTGSKDIAGDALADMVRKQRLALDASGNQDAATKTMAAALSDNKNACDTGLRTCMRTKCGNDFSKCSGDGDTIWGDKMESCRRGINCSGEEYRLFAVEIKSDRDFNAKLAEYNNVLDCGNKYNTCIITRCGPMLNKCIGKVAGDAAIAECATIAKNCQTADNGLANRTMQIFATLRNDAEVQIKKDEARLYELRDLMTSQCRRLGAMFDERSLDCVFTVNFFAGTSSTPYASKKAYGGNSFDCDQNWFGVDVTTFKENAYRLTRSQTAATSALMGAGLGVAAGALTSGAIGRAVDSAKAKKAEKNAEKEHKENFEDKAEKDEKNKDKKDKSADEDKEDGDDDSKEAEKNCKESGGTWKSETKFCDEPDCGDNSRWDDFSQKCKEYDEGEKPLEISDQQKRCELAGGSWASASCMCPNAGKWNITSGICEAAPKLNFDTSLSKVSLSGASENKNSLSQPLNFKTAGPVSNNTNETFADKLKASTSNKNVLGRGLTTR